MRSTFILAAIAGLVAADANSHDDWPIMKKFVKNLDTHYEHHKALFNKKIVGQEVSTDGTSFDGAEVMFKDGPLDERWEDEERNRKTGEEYKELIADYETTISDAWKSLHKHLLYVVNTSFLWDADPGPDPEPEPEYPEVTKLGNLRLPYQYIWTMPDIERNVRLGFAGSNKSVNYEGDLGTVNGAETVMNKWSVGYNPDTNENSGKDFEWVFDYAVGVIDTTDMNPFALVGPISREVKTLDIYGWFYEFHEFSPNKPGYGMDIDVKTYFMGADAYHNVRGNYGWDMEDVSGYITMQDAEKNMTSFAEGRNLLATVTIPWDQITEDNVNLQVTLDGMGAHNFNWRWDAIGAVFNK